MVDKIEIEAKQVVGDSAGDFIPLILWGKGDINPALNTSTRPGVPHKHFLIVKTPEGPKDAFPTDWIRNINGEWSVMHDADFREQYKV